MELANVVPWGRSFDEYKDIFSLSERDLNKKILGCGDGPACFNAELTKAGGRVISIDPIYQFSGSEIRSRIEQVFPQIMSQMKNSADDYIWNSIRSVDDLGKIRMKAMEAFLGDYELGKKTGRYIHASLPELPFDDYKFDLALCSHYLFLYSDQVKESRHILSMKELCRVAREVRVYPLLSLNGKTSVHLEPVMSALAPNGIEVSLRDVKYQFQKGATQMLVANSV